MAIFSFLKDWYSSFMTRRVGNTDSILELSATSDFSNFMYCFPRKEQCHSKLRVNCDSNIESSRLCRTASM